MIPPCQPDFKEITLVTSGFPKSVPSASGCLQSSISSGSQVSEIVPYHTEMCGTNLTNKQKIEMS